MRRGSNVWAASIVSTTTAMKYTTPEPGATDISGVELHQRHDERVDEDVEHRPAADEFDQPIQPRAVVVALRRAALHR